MYEVLVCGLCGVCVVTVLPDLYVDTPPTASNTLLQLPQFSKKFLPTILYEVLKSDLHAVPIISYHVHCI